MADEPIKPSEQKIEPKKDTVRITLPPKIGTPAGAPARPASQAPATPTVRLPSPTAPEATPIARKESDTKSISGGKKRETQTIKTDTSKVRTSSAPAAAARPAAPAGGPRPTTVRLPSPAEVQQAAARQLATPPAPLSAPASAGIPVWMAGAAAVVAIVTVVTAILLFLQYQALGS